MGSIKIAGKNIVTQSGSDEPTISSNVVFPAGNIQQIQTVTCTSQQNFSSATPAAVTDFKPAEKSKNKIKKNKFNFKSINFVKNNDILDFLSKR